MGLFFLPSYLHGTAFSPAYSNRLPHLLKVVSSTPTLMGVHVYTSLLILTPSRSFSRLFRVYHMIDNLDTVSYQVMVVAFSSFSSSLLAGYMKEASF